MRSAAPRSSKLFLECRRPGAEAGVGVGSAVGVDDGAAPLFVGFSEPEGSTEGAGGCAGRVGRPVVFDRSAGSGSAEYLGEGVVGVICTGGQHEARHTVGQGEDTVLGRIQSGRAVLQETSRRPGAFSPRRFRSILPQERPVRAVKESRPIWSLNTAAWAKRPSGSWYRPSTVARPPR